MPDFEAMHDAVERAKWAVTHGTHSGYCAGCRCTLCRRANADYQNAYKHRRRQNGGTLKQRKTPTCAPGNLSIEPLLRLFEHLELSDEELAVRFGTTRHAIIGWRRRGLSLRLADQVAVHIGVHPIEIWGNDYWSAQ